MKAGDGDGVDDEVEVIVAGCGNHIVNRIMNHILHYIVNFILNHDLPLAVRRSKVSRASCPRHRPPHNAKSTSTPKACILPI